MVVDLLGHVKSKSHNCMEDKLVVAVARGDNTLRSSSSELSWWAFNDARTGSNNTSSPGSPLFYIAADSKMASLDVSAAVLELTDDNKNVFGSGSHTISRAYQPCCSVFVLALVLVLRSRKPVKRQTVALQERQQLICSDLRGRMTHLLWFFQTLHLFSALVILGCDGGYVVKEVQISTEPWRGRKGLDRYRRVDRRSELAFSSGTGDGGPEK